MRNLLIKFLSSLFFGIFLFDRNNLVFVSAALTFYFVLSLIPVFLIFVSILNYFAFAEPKLLYDLVKFLQDFNESAGSWFYQLVVSTTAINPLSFGFSGAVSLLFTSLLFSKGLSYAYYLIFQYSPGKISSILAPFLLNISLVFLVIGAVVLKVALVVINTIFKDVIKFDIGVFTSFVEKLLTAPSIVIFFMVTMSYYLLSGRKINFFFALFLSGIFSLSLIFMNIFYNSFVNLNFYRAVYGQIGIIIFSLYWIYLIFALYLFFVQFGYSFVKNIDISLEYCVKNLKSHKFLKKNLSKLFLNNLKSLFVGISEILDSEMSEKKLLLVSESLDILDKRRGDILQLDELKELPMNADAVFIVLKS